MKIGDWKKINNFTYKEKWGDPTQMDFRLIWRLDLFREELDHKIIVHCGYDLSGHAPKSFHKVGKAVDFHVERLSLSTVYSYLEKMWWVGGVGVYPYWNSPGFHIDLGTYRRWYRDENNEYYYADVGSYLLSLKRSDVEKENKIMLTSTGKFDPIWY